MRKVPRIIATGITLAILLVIPFCWNEDLDFSAKINHEKIASYFSVLGGIAAIASAVYLYLQLQVLKDSFQAASHPDIYPENLVFEVDENLIPASQANLKSTRLVTLKQRRMSGGQFVTGTPLVNLYNIGIGPAKKLEAIWVYDNSELRKFINGQYSFGETNNKPVTFNFVLPNQGREINVPFNYMACCGPNLNPPIQTPAKPLLKLKVAYEDLYLNRYEKVYMVTIVAFQKVIEMSFE